MSLDQDTTTPLCKKASDRCGLECLDILTVGILGRQFHLLSAIFSREVKVKYSRRKKLITFYVLLINGVRRHGILGDTLVLEHPLLFVEYDIPS